MKDGAPSGVNGEEDKMDEIQLTEDQANYLLYNILYLPGSMMVDFEKTVDLWKAHRFIKKPLKDEIHDYLLEYDL